MGLVPSPLMGMLKSLLFISYIFIFIFLWGLGGAGGMNRIQCNPFLYLLLLSEL